MSAITKEQRAPAWLRAALALRDKAAAGDIVMAVAPPTLVSVPLSSAWTRTCIITLKTAAGEVHNWFSSAITSGVSIGDTSTAGTASIPSTTLTFKNGVASVVVSGDAEDWLNTETDTLTVTELDVLGYTQSAVTSVETFTTP